MKKTFLSLLLGAGVCLSAQAQFLYDQDVTPDVIFGSGNDDGGFTINDDASTTGIEVGLRAKLRFNDSGSPENTFNSNGDGSYTFSPGAAVGGATWVSSTTPVWNFDWSVNTDTTGLTGAKIGDYTYELSMDFDPGPGTGLTLDFDPITPTVSTPFFDHAFGTATTGNGAGSVAGDQADYNTFLATKNVVQNSWNYEFFNDSPFDIFDPNVAGTYTIGLGVFDGSAQVAYSEIDVSVIPEPGTVGAIGLLGLVGFLYWRKRKAAQA